MTKILTPSSLPWIPIMASSNVELIHHQGTTLTVVYSDRKNAYSYDSVSPEQYSDMMKADSLGSWLHKNIKSNKNIKVTKTPFKG